MHSGPRALTGGKLHPKVSPVFSGLQDSPALPALAANRNCQSLQKKQSLQASTVLVQCTFCFVLCLLQINITDQAHS